MNRLTYGDFARTGTQDAANVFDVSEHREAWIRLGKPASFTVATASLVVIEAWGNEADQRDAWLDQQDVDEMVQAGLDPLYCHLVWRTAWRAHATACVLAMIPDWIATAESQS